VAPLHAAGIESIHPDRYRLGALVRVLCEYLTEHRVRRIEHARRRHRPRAHRAIAIARQLVQALDRRRVGVRAILARRRVRAHRANRGIGVA